MALLLSFALADTAPDKVATCTACHGPAGVTNNDLWPNLAGQKEKYLQQQLHDFRSGARVNAIMGPVARMLTDQDIEKLAAYYSHLEKPQ